MGGNSRIHSLKIRAAGKRIGIGLTKIVDSHLLGSGDGSLPDVPIAVHHSQDVVSEIVVVTQYAGRLPITVRRGGRLGHQPSTVADHDAP